VRGRSEGRIFALYTYIDDEGAVRSVARKGAAAEISFE
jgi:hypothetical protein